MNMYNGITRIYTRCRHSPIDPEVIDVHSTLCVVEFGLARKTMGI